METMAWKLVPGLFNFHRILCKKESEEASMLIWTNFESFAITYLIKYRAGKIRFSGTQKSMLLKASSGECCASCNFVLLVTLRGSFIRFISFTWPCTK